MWKKKDWGVILIFMLFFSTLVRRLVYDEQQRTQATLLKFWLPFFYFKDHPASFKLQSHPTLGIQCGKKRAKNFPLHSPAFYRSLASSLATDDKKHNTSYLLPPPFFGILTRVYWLRFRYRRVCYKYPQVRPWKCHLPKYRRIIQVHL